MSKSAAAADATVAGATVTSAAVPSMAAKPEMSRRTIIELPEKNFPWMVRDALRAHRLSLDGPADRFPGNR